MRQALGLATPLILFLVAPAAMADGYYIGVTGGYSEIRDSRFGFNNGDTQAEVDYDGGETLSLTFGTISRSKMVLSARSELELGFQRDTADSITFEEPSGEGDSFQGDDGGADDPEDIGEDDESTEEETEISDAGVSGTTDVAYGFYNVMGDYGYTSSLNFTGGFGIGLGRVEFDTVSARGRGVILDDEDITWGWQVSAGVSYQVIEQVDLEVLYRLRGWEDISMESEDGLDNQFSFASHNFLTGLRVRF